MSWVLTLTEAWRWTERLVALSVLLQTIELLQLRWAWASDGIWRFSVLSSEHRYLPAPLRWLFAALLPYRPFWALLWLRLLASLALPCVSGSWPLLLVLLLSQVAIGVRFRGTFNGGSDTLSVIVLLALTVGAWVGGSLAHKAALGYIAIQLSLSYFVAGIAKLKEPEWRSGVALRAFCRSAQYGSPLWLRSLLERLAAFRALSWCVLGFECGFPLAWLDTRVASGLLLLAIAFHLGNWLLFGLNRFLWTWLAAYPALLYASGLLGRVS